MPKVQAQPTRSGGRGHRVSTSLAEINVVPLVDVMLVLLIIFMVTAPMIQRGVDVNLPQSKSASAITGEPVFVTVPASFRTDHMVYLGTERLATDIMQERVRQKMDTLQDKHVYLRGDGAVQLQDLMTVIDLLKAAGVTNVGMVAKAPGEL
ncbi:MAG: biopolymer transporter ExbD [Acidobacteriaceae bacterium]|nr:biopolymer transporter ExbD [Acidobacteriaceae bacterium]